MGQNKARYQSGLYEIEAFFVIREIFKNLSQYWLLRQFYGHFDVINLVYHPKCGKGSAPGKKEFIRKALPPLYQLFGQIRPANERRRYLQKGKSQTHAI